MQGSWTDLCFRDNEIPYSTVIGCELSVFLAKIFAEGDPSVHALNTPRNSKAISEAWASLVCGNMAALRRIAVSAGEALGPGFFVHDVLPASDGRLLVCESGIKFDDATYANHLASIKNDLPFLSDILTWGHIPAAADALVSSLRYATRGLP